MSAAIEIDDSPSRVVASRRGATVMWWHDSDDRSFHVEIDALEARDGMREFPVYVLRELRALPECRDANDTIVHLAAPVDDLRHEAPSSRAASARLLRVARRAAARTRPRCYACSFTKACNVHVDDGALADLYEVDMPKNDVSASERGADREPREWQRGDHVEGAEFLVRELASNVRDIIADEGKVWSYGNDEGIWRPLDPALMSRTVQSFAGDTLKVINEKTGEEKDRPLSIKASDVAGIIRLARDRIARDGFFASAEPGIVFGNGFLRVTKNGARLEAHRREHRARARYAFDFVPCARPMQTILILEGLFRDDADRDAKILAFQEFGGACTTRIAPTFQRAFYATGLGDNGKSTAANLIAGAMPPGTVVSVTPQDMGHEYKRAMLVGAHINLVNEVAERDVVTSEAFKAIVVGDPVSARHPHERACTVSIRAGHWFGMNALHGTTDFSEGFWRRPLVLTFNRSFKGDPTRERDIDKRVLAAELPLIVSWFIEGAVRLMRQGEYTMPASHHDALNDWRRNADQVALFLDAETRALREDEPATWGTAGADLYAAYRKWADANGHRALASNKLGMRLRELGVPSSHTKRGTRYPLAILTNAERVTDSGGGDGQVTDRSSPRLREVARA